jgi:hypothetical protein
MALVTALAVAAPAQAETVQAETVSGFTLYATAVTSSAPGRVVLVTQDLILGLTRRVQSGGVWSAPVVISAGATSGQPATLSASPGAIEVVVRGGAGFQWFAPGLPSDGQPVPGTPATTLTSPPGISSWGPARLDVFAVAGDGALWHTWYNKNWSNRWENLGGNLNPNIAPAAVSWGSGRIDIVARGNDNAIWHLWYNDNWGHWESLGTTPGIATATGPGIATSGAGHLRIYAVDNAGTPELYQLPYDNAWGSWTAEAAVPAAFSASATYTPDNRFDVTVGLRHIWITP